MGTACSCREVKGAIFEFEWKTTIFSLIPKYLRVQMHLIVDTAVAQSADIESLKNSCGEKETKSRDDAKSLKTTGKDTDVTTADENSSTEKETAKSIRLRSRNKKYQSPGGKGRRAKSNSTYLKNSAPFSLTILVYESILLLLTLRPPGTTAQTEQRIPVQVNTSICLPSHITVREGQNISLLVQWYFENNVAVYTKISKNGQLMSSRFDCHDCHVSSSIGPYSFCIQTVKPQHQGHYTCEIIGNKKETTQHVIYLEVIGLDEPIPSSEINGSMTQRNDTTPNSLTNKTTTDVNANQTPPVSASVIAAVCVLAVMLPIGILISIIVCYKQKLVRRCVTFFRTKSWKSSKSSRDDEESQHKGLNESNNTEGTERELSLSLIKDSGRCDDNHVSNGIGLLPGHSEEV